jgi:MTH538 TIR-like domain (DUF1863)
MARVPVFYSFHFDNDVMRVQLIRNIGALDGNEPVSKNDWETVRRGGDSSIQRWIDENMKYKRCVVVLIGSETAARPWVQYEIKKAWDEKRGLLGIHIHNINCPRSGTCAKGRNPFEQFTVGGRPLSHIVRCHDPNPLYAYQDIQNNLVSWIDAAIASRS